MYWSRIAVCVVGLSLSAPALAQDRQVRVANPAEYDKAVRAARAGDTIVLADGVWRDFRILFSGRGTADKPITLTAETRGGVILSGQSNLRLAGTHLVVSGLVFRDGYSPTGDVIAFRRTTGDYASNSRVTEVVIDRFNKPDRRAQDNWVSIYGTDNRVDHSHFEGKTNAGVTLAVIRPKGEPGPNRARIDHNYFGHRPPLGANGGETIRIGTSDESLSDSASIVERNIFERTDGEVEIVSIKSGANVLRENLVLSSQGAFVLRHGNGNLVERNVFLGNGVSNSAGIRVINRDQTVRHNYLEGLAGRDLKSALSVMNGVPDSAINRYHQVANARIHNNSILDVARVTLAAGADAERSAAPVDSRFERNLVSGANGSDPFTAPGEIGGIAFAGNVQARVAKPLLSEGVTQADLTLERAANGLLYPTDPALADVGAPRDLKPVTRAEVGVNWYKPVAAAAFGSGRTVSLSPGQSIADAVAGLDDGGTVALAPGRYTVARAIPVTRTVTLSGAGDPAPTITLADGGFLDIAGGGGVTVEGLALRAHAATRPAIAVTPQMTGNYRLALSRVTFSGDGAQDVIALSPGTFADEIRIEQSRFDTARTVVAAAGETTGRGFYPVERLTIADSHFARVGMVADLLRGGTDESTFGPFAHVSGSTVTDSGRGSASLRLSGAQQVRVTDNRFERSGPVEVIHSVGTPDTQVTGNVFAATPAPVVRELIHEGPPRGTFAPNRMEQN
jgi:poly(beta-D-mannuronate) lyase